MGRAVWAFIENEVWVLKAAGRHALARVLCIANQKGGVGKTTTAVNLADALAKSDRRTLLVDLDPQCNATSALGAKAVDHHPLLMDEPLSDLQVGIYPDTLAVLPGSRNIDDVQRLAASDETDRRHLLSRLATTHATFDTVVIDCPPSLGRLTQPALMASTEVLMPLQCEFFAMEGLTQMIEVIRDVMHSETSQLDFGGILLTMYDPTLELTLEVDAEVRDFFGEVVFETVIPRDINAAEAPSHGQSVLEYAPRCRATRAYIELCMEVLERDDESE